MKQPTIATSATRFFFLPFSSAHSSHTTAAGTAERFPRFLSTSLISYLAPALTTIPHKPGPMGYSTLVVTLVLLGSRVRASSSTPSDSTDSGSSTSSSGAPSTSVQWTSPTSGDTFGPGERINIKWQAPGKTSSPSFRVCEESGDCGSTIWPQIQQTGEVYATIVCVFWL